MDWVAMQRVAHRLIPVVVMVAVPASGFMLQRNALADKPSQADADASSRAFRTTVNSASARSSHASDANLDAAIRTEASERDANVSRPHSCPDGMRLVD